MKRGIATGLAAVLVLGLAGLAYVQSTAGASVDGIGAISPVNALPGEIEELRTRDAKYFRDADGTMRAVFGNAVHYEAAPGFWRDVDLAFREDGEDFLVDHNAVVVRVSGDRLRVTGRDTNTGIEWVLPSSPNVAGQIAEYVDADSLRWTYTTQPDGVKLSAVVSRMVGPKVFHFPFNLVGGTSLRLDDAGNVVGDGFSVPPPTIVGKSGRQLGAPAWQLSDGTLSFEFDDSTVPEAELPYVIDPTTQSAVVSDGDGSVQGQGTDLAAMSKIERDGVAGGPLVSDDCDSGGVNINDGTIAGTYVKLKTKAPTPGALWVCYRVDRDADPVIHEGGKLTLAASSEPVTDTNADYCAARRDNAVDVDATVGPNQTPVFLHRLSPPYTLGEIGVCLRAGELSFRASAFVRPDGAGPSITSSLDGAIERVERTFADGVPSTGDLAGDYTISNLLLRWDTSSLPDSATVTSAKVGFHAADVTSSDPGLRLTADWHVFEPASVQNSWTHNARADALAGVPLASVVAGESQTLTLSNPSGVNKEGLSGLRFHLDGGTVAGVNRLGVSTRDNPDATLSDPMLEVTFDLPDGFDGSEKGAAVLSGAPIATPLPDLPHATLMPPTSDSGDPAVVAAVKVAVPQAMQLIGAAMRLPADLAQRADIVNDPDQLTARNGMLAQAISSDVLPQQSAEIQAALELVRDDPTYRAYQDNTFTVDSWEGVTVSLTGTTATVLLRGHHNYFDAAGWEPDDVKQWQLEVANIDGVWKIRSTAAVRLEDADTGISAVR